MLMAKTKTVKTKKFYREIGAKGGAAKVRKGFGWMDPERRRIIARQAAAKRWAAVEAAEEAK